MPDKSTRRTKELRSLHRLFLRLQQRNRAVGAPFPGGFSLPEAHFMMELDADPARCLTDLESLLRLDLSTVSRIGMRLSRRGLLLRRRAALDSRRYDLVITAMGRGLIERTDEIADGLLQSFAENLTAAEVGKLRDFFSDVSEALGIPAGKVRPREHVLRVEQRRLTRALGLLSSTVGGSDLSPSHYHALSYIGQGEGTMNARIIMERLALAQNSVSAIVASLSKHGLITQREEGGDRRRRALAITRKGERALGSIEKSEAGKLRRALANYSDEELRRARALLERFVGESAEPGTLASGAKVRLLAQAERESARGAFLRFLLNCGWEDAAPAEILGPRQIATGAFEGDKLVAIALFERTGGATVLVAAAWSARPDAEAAAEMIRRSLELLPARDAFEIEFAPLRSLVVDGSRE
jgi:DNA-binding MarR family transcriptional regulator